MALNALIVGGGRVGTALAALLREGGHQVTVVDGRSSVCARLRAELGEAVVHEGPVTEPGTLDAAGIRRADVVAAVTAADATNLVITCLARFHFGVERTVARIVDPARAWMYVPDMGVDVALNQADLIAHVVAEEMSLGAMTTLLKLRRGQYALVEERVHPDAPAAGQRFEDLDLPAGCVIVAVLRAGTPMLRHTGVLEPGDDVLAVVHDTDMTRLAALLSRADDHGGAARAEATPDPGPGNGPLR